MALANYTVLPSGIEGPSRRAVLTMVPGAIIGTAIGISTASALVDGADGGPTESPIMRLYRLHRAICDRFDASAGSDEPVAFDANIGRLDEIERKMLAIPATDALDLVAKFAVAFSFGEFLPADTSLGEALLWQDARRILGRA